MDDTWKCIDDAWNSVDSTLKSQDPEQGHRMHDPNTSAQNGPRKFSEPVVKIKRMSGRTAMIG